MKTNVQYQNTVVVDLATHNLEKQAESFVAQEAQNAAFNPRQQALKNFKKLGLPNTRHEDWKYTDLHALISQKFHLQTAQEIAPLQPEQELQIQSYIKNILSDRNNEGLDADVLVIVDGRYNGELSILSEALSKNNHGTNYRGSLNELVSLASEHSNKALLDKVCRLSLADNAVYNLINATWLDGVAINLTEQGLKYNICILHVDSGNCPNSMINTKHVCILQDNVSLELTHEYLSLDNASHSSSNHNVTLDIILQKNARCNHYVLQNYKSDVFHLATYYIQQEANSEYSNFNFNFGAKLSRQDIMINQAEDRATTALYGLSLPHNTQHMDSHLKIYHNSSHGKSFQDYRYVLADRGHGVFNGMVYVAEETVANHAEQSNKNILLSTNAQIDTKPELQIYSDDVTCRHGATIGKLDELSLFYLQSRGIDVDAARKLLVLAFIQHIGELVKNASVARWLDEKLNSIIDKI